MKPQILIWPIQMLHNLFFEQTTINYHYYFLFDLAAEWRIHFYKLIIILQNSKTSK